LREEYEARVERLLGLMSEKGLDACVLCGRSNVRYFAGMRQNAAVSSVLLALQGGDLVYLVPLLDERVARRECWISGAGKIVTFPEDTPNYLEPVARELQRIGAAAVGIDFGSTSLEKREMLGESLSGVDVGGDLLRLRSVKSPWELERIREAARIADAAMCAVLDAVAAGRTEAELVALALRTMVASGAEGASFEPFLMSGENSWLPRRYSTSKRLAGGEIALFDMGAVVDGYCSDITRTFCVGEPSNEQRRIFEIALRAQRAAIAAVRPGARAGEIDDAARSVIEDAGYGENFPHLTGHGLGLDVHELPIADEGREMVLQEGMVLTVEPGVYVEGVGGARVEDMVLVTRDGHEVLTRTRREL